MISNIILPGKPKRWTEKIILAATHLTNTAGIAAATYGGSPNPTGGVISENLNQIGNCMILFVMFGICWWMWPTWKKIMNFRRHPNFSPARFMIIFAGVAMPFQLIRLAYNTLYAFSPSTDLDPFVGSFGIRFLIFTVQLGVTFALMTGGWLSVGILPESQLPQQIGENGSPYFYDEGLETMALKDGAKPLERFSS